MAEEFHQKVIIEAVDKVSKEVGAIKDALDKQFKGVEKSTDRMKMSMDGARSSILGVKAAILGVGAILTGKTVGAFIAAGDEVEQLSARFEVLLGSADKAAKKVSDLNALGMPFRLDDLGAGAFLMERFTNSAYAGADALKVVGDAAKFSNQSFETVAGAVAKAYSTLENVGEFGVAARQLTRMGLASGDAVEAVVKLQEAGRSAEAWKMLERELKTAEGQMEKFAGTAKGLRFAIGEDLQDAMRKMMEDGTWDLFKDSLKSVHERMAAMVQDGTFSNVARGFIAIGGAVKDVTTYLTDLPLAWFGVDEALEKASKSAGYLKEIADTKKVRQDLTDLRDMQNEYVAEANKNFTGVTWKGLMLQDDIKKKKQEIQDQIGYNLELTRGTVEERITFLDRQIQDMEIRSRELAATAKAAITVPEPNKTKPPPSFIAPAAVVDYSSAVDDVIKDIEKRRAEAWQVAISNENAIEDQRMAAREESMQAEIDAETMHLQRLTDVRQNAVAEDGRFVAAATEASDKRVDGIRKKWADKAQKDIEAATEKERTIQDARREMIYGVAESWAGAASNVAKALGVQGNGLKAFALVEGAINTARAFSGALAAPPYPPASIPQAIASGALAASKVAVIAAQKFHDGGEVPGQGEVPTILLSKEGVLNRRAMAIMGSQELRARNRGEIPQQQPAAQPISVSVPVTFSPVISIGGGGSAPESVVAGIQGNLPALAEMVKQAMQRGYLRLTSFAPGVKGGSAPVLAYRG